MKCLMSKPKLLLASSAFLLLSCPVARACVCARTPTVAESFKEAKVIFVGRVIARGQFGAWLKVEKSWKGVSSETIYLYTGNLENDCDPRFGTKGEVWLVYASIVPLYRSENATTPYTYKLMARGCDRTSLLVNANEDLKALGEGKAPLEKRTSQRLLKR